MKFNSRLFIHSFLNKRWLAISGILVFFLSGSWIMFADMLDEIKSIYSRFNLQEIVRIDTEDKALIEKGLSDIQRFTVDNENNIYILNPRTGGDSIFVVDKAGKFLRSFGKKGQGPGELENPAEMLLSSEGNLFVQELISGRVTIFSRDGTFLEVKRLSPGTGLVGTLSDGNFLGLEAIYGGEVKEWVFALNYYDSEFRKIKELDRLTLPNPVASKTISASPNVIACHVSGDRIYSAYPERGYEFMVFNLRGEFIRKISMPAKKSTNLTMYKKIMDRELGNLTRFGIKLNYTKYALPFYSYFTDEHGYLFVMTFEPGKEAGEYFYDIVSPEGKLINKVSLGPYFSQGNILAKIFRNHLYLVKEKESGEKELVVYRIN